MDLSNELNRVLKYNSEAERQAFEKNIDDNPLEATNHLVYADWLDDNGEPEEGAFRRSMGEWFAKHKFNDLHSHIPKATNAWRIHPQHLPAGVDEKKIDRSPDTVGVGAQASTFLGSNRLGWRTYRDMESAFRQAFQLPSSTTPE